VDGVSSSNAVSLDVVNGAINGIGTNNLPNIAAPTIILIATNGVGTLNTLELDADNLDVSVSGAGGINVTDTANGLIVDNATTQNGSIAITALATGADLEVTLAVAGGSGDISLTTLGDGNILVTDVQAAGDSITINSAGSINPTGTAAPVTLLALDVALTAATGIGDQAALNVDATTLSALVTVAGAINVRDVNSITVTNATTPNGPVTLSTLGGSLTVIVANAGLDDVTLTSGGAGSSVVMTDITAGGTVLVTSAGDIIQTVASVVTAGTDVTFTAAQGILMGLVRSGGTASITANGGSILDGNDVTGEAMNLQTNGNAAMFAQGTIGTIGNCIEVEIGGSLTATSGMGPGIASINLCGTTNGGLVVLLPNNGVLNLNGRLIDPVYIQGIRYTPFYYWDLRRKFDKYAQYPMIETWVTIPVPITDERIGSDGGPGGN
jgi:hypothetical protein